MAPLEGALLRRDVAAAAARTAAVEARGVALTYRTADAPVRALAGVDLTIGHGEFVSLIGPWGCGKTTLLRMIADLDRPTGGALLVDGTSPEQARLRRAYGYVFQAPALLLWRTVEANIALPLEVMGVPRAERLERARRQLALVGLAEFGRRFPWQLSGGMQQRVSIARALALEPALLMDEPFSALDEIARDHLKEQLLALWRRTGKTVVFVTHSISEAVFLSTRIAVMSPRPGRITEVVDCAALGRDRPLEIREAPAFLEITRRVRLGLRAGESYARR